MQTIRGFRDHIWAPDISFHNGLYYLYNSVSSFGKNTSCIGVGTNKTLHPGSADYKWTDHGKLSQSVPGRDLGNAIGPNLIKDEKGTPWVVDTTNYLIFHPYDANDKGRSKLRIEKISWLGGWPFKRRNPN